MSRLLFSLLLLAAPAAHAQGFQSTTTLDRAVASFTGKPVGAEGGARSVVDTRLKLASCPALALSWRSDAHDAVVVTCMGPEWRMFVPVRYTPTAPKPAIPSPVAVVAVPAAAPVKIDPVIKRGDPVTIEAGSPGFSIMREGVAMGDAGPGVRFMVRVDGARAPVQAVAVASGRATLPGWGE